MKRSETKLKDTNISMGQHQKKVRKSKVASDSVGKKDYKANNFNQTKGNDYIDEILTHKKEQDKAQQQEVINKLCIFKIYILLDFTRRFKKKDIIQITCICSILFALHYWYHLPHFITYKFIESIKYWILVYFKWSEYGFEHFKLSCSYSRL